MNMGVGRYILEFLEEVSIDLSGMKMCELGNQIVHPNVGMNPDGTRMTSKDYFEARGVHHYSIDWNGLDGAYPLDMSKTIRDHFWLDRFDIVTNLGMSEHVLGQFECFENIHNFTKVGGYMFHVLPCEWDKDHAPHTYPEDFFLKVRDHNKYSIVGFKNYKAWNDPSKSSPPCTANIVLYRKLNNKMFCPDKETFESWINHGK